MPKLQLIVRGSDGDHQLTSPTLSEEDARDQLSDVSNRLGGHQTVRLPWATVAAGSMVSAQVVPDVPASTVASWQ